MEAPFGPLVVPTVEDHEIRLVDHLILGSGGRWVSLKQRGAC